MSKLNNLQEYTGYRWDALNKQAMENKKITQVEFDEIIKKFDLEDEFITDLGGGWFKIGDKEMQIITTIKGLEEFDKAMREYAKELNNEK